LAANGPWCIGRRACPRADCAAAAGGVYPCNGAVRKTGGRVSPLRKVLVLAAESADDALLVTELRALGYEVAVGPQGLPPSDADLYRDLVENSYDLICTHDSEGRLLSVNAAAEKAL